MNRFERDNQTVFRAEQRLAFIAGMNRTSQAMRRMHMAVVGLTEPLGALKAAWRPAGWSRYTAGEKELRRDRSRG